VFLVLTMAPAEGRNVRNKLFSAVLGVVFMIKIFTSSQVFRLPLFNISYKYTEQKKMQCCSSQRVPTLNW